MNIIEKAIHIAITAHAGQVDKAGKPYILHPLRLMIKLDNKIEMVSALLHDVVEDSYYTFEDLEKEGMPAATIDIIKHLTRKENETYDDFIVRVSKNMHAKRIKLLDIEDNMDISRLDGLTQKDLDRLNKYHRAKKILEGREEM